MSIVVHASTSFFKKILPSRTSSGCEFVENESKTNDRVTIGGERSRVASVKRPEILWKSFCAPKFTGDQNNIVWISAISSHRPGNYSVDIPLRILASNIVANRAARAAGITQRPEKL
jgi:hypothetical protein